MSKFHYVFKGLCLVGIMAALCITMCSCGHNAVQYGDGIGFDMGVNPENFALSFNLRYGKILSAAVRDNTEIELSGKANADGSAGSDKAASGSTSTDGNLKIKIGRQINGAAVDLVKAGANADKVLQELCGGTAENKEAETKAETKTVTETKAETAAKGNAAEAKTENKAETAATENAAEAKTENKEVK